MGAIQVPVQVESLRPDAWVYRVTGTRGVMCSTSVYRTEAAARTAIKANVLHVLREADVADCDQRRAILGCRDGTVLLVERCGYRVAGPTRRDALGGCLLPGASHAESLEAAKRHAEQSYGGVAWSNSL